VAPGGVIFLQNVMKIRQFAQKLLKETNRWTQRYNNLANCKLNLKIRLNTEFLLKELKMEDFKIRL
jgi:hypothetical protein